MPGVILTCSGAALAQTTTQPGLPKQGQASPAPSGLTAKRYTLPDVFNNQAHPGPAATAAPGRLLVNGKVRGYDFQRLNREQSAAAPNRHALEFAVEPHLDYRIGDTPLNIGYTYAGATGFGFNGPNPIKNGNVDNTLPGFPINSPIHEAYVQYRDANNTVTVGDQELNYAWTPLSDSRVIPSSYQGLDSSFKLTKTLAFGLTRIVRFEQRNSSNFEDNTLLTAPYPQTSSLIAKSGTETPGTLRVGLTYKPSSRVSILAENYEMYNIANLAYAEGKFALGATSVANPYLAIQYVAENSLGQNQIGRIKDHTIGGQLGANVAKGLLLTGSFDVSPWHYAIVHSASMLTATKGYFVGSGGTGTVAPAGDGTYRVAYGGIASPYTDSLGTDPLYTTMITQGMADRRSAGNAYKTALVYTTPDKQLKLIAAEAWFQYSNDIARNLTSEFNIDGTYYFNKVRSGPYKGFFVRVRIAPRTQPTTPYNFEYQRFITEYDF
jgi:hypothetical protein